MSSSGWQSKTSRLRGHAASKLSAAVTANSRGLETTEAMPQRMLQPSKATASTAAALSSFLAADSVEPIRPSFCTPIKPVVEAPADDSDNSMRTARCASDKISRDSLEDVVRSMTAKYSLPSCLQQQRQDHQQQQQQLKQQKQQKHPRQPAVPTESDEAPPLKTKAERSRHSDSQDVPSMEKKSRTKTHASNSNSNHGAAAASTSAVTMTTDAAEQPKRRTRATGTDVDSAAKHDRRHCHRDDHDDCDVADDGDCNGGGGDSDASRLLQLLIGRAYGSDCLKVRGLCKTVETSSSSVSIVDGGAAAASVREAAADHSLMTLTCGDLSKTMMTHIQMSNGCRLGGDAAAAAAATAAIVTATGSATATPPQAAPTGGRTRPRGTRAGGSGSGGECRRSANCSSMSLNGSEAPTVAGGNLPSMVEETILQSDRLARSIAAGDGVHGLGGGSGGGGSGGDGSGGGGSAMQHQEAAAADAGTDAGSTLIVDLGDIVLGARGDCHAADTDSGSFCRCDDNIGSAADAGSVRCRVSRQRSRCGRLRTPEVCKRTATTRSASTTRQSLSRTEAASATTTAVEAEWWDQEAAAGRRASTPDRQRIDTSDEDDGVSGRSSRGRGSSATRASSQREKQRKQKKVEQRRPAKVVQHSTTRLQRQRSQAESASAELSAKPPRKSEKQGKKKPEKQQERKKKQEKPKRKTSLRRRSSRDS